MAVPYQLKYEFRKLFAKTRLGVAEAAFKTGFEEGSRLTHEEPKLRTTLARANTWVLASQKNVLEGVLKIRRTPVDLPSLSDGNRQTTLQIPDEGWRPIGEVAGMYHILFKETFHWMEQEGRSVVTDDRDTFLKAFRYFITFCEFVEAQFLKDFFFRCCKEEMRKARGAGGWNMLYFMCLEALR